MALSLPMSHSATLETKKHRHSKDTGLSGSLMDRSHSRHRSATFLKHPELPYCHIPMAKDTPDWRQSSTTLRHSSRAYKFSQSQRFPRYKCNYEDAMQIKYHSLLGRRSSGFGIGEKASIPQVSMPGQKSPQQNFPFYEAKSDFSMTPKDNAKTFGLGWRAYEPSRAMHRNTVHSCYQVRQNPGPNAYKINPQSKSPKIKMHQRLQMFTTRNGTYRLSEPDPFSYKINEKLVKRQLSGKGIGIGNRSDFTAPFQHNPAAIYNIKGMGDAFGHLQVKLKLK